MRDASSPFAIPIFGGLLALLLLGEVLGLSSTLQAQQKAGSSPSTAAAPPSAANGAFMREAAGGGMTEVELGRQEHLKLVESMSSPSTTEKPKP